MTYSALVSRTISTPNQSSRGGRKIDHVVLHHGALTNFAALLRLMGGAKEVSANVGISSDGEIVGVVPEENRAWSLSSALWDGRSLTAEICNESAGGAWPVSDAAHEAAARWVADVCRRYNIPCNRERVIGHREVFARHGASYATACPGGLDLDGIVARASQLMAGTASLDPTPIAIPKDDDMTIYLKPTSNSSPLAGPSAISRIWQGFRTIAGIDYSDVWGVDGNGDARRLTAVQWRVLNALKDRGLITLNVVDVSGNDLEQIVYAPRF